MFRYIIRHDSDIPIYKQLVDQINAEIRSGVLKTGTQLPTVREMADRLGLSLGTVKRAYDLLQEMGDIEMTRRRGTFVKYVRQGRDSRKLQAMTAIDRMIRQLTDLNFSPAEINIFVNLKMREWGLRWSGIRIAVVTEYPDMSRYIEKQLQLVGNATVMVWDARQVRDYPYNLDEQSDVILASRENVRWLENVLPDRSKLICVAFGMNKQSLVGIASASGKIGVLMTDESTHSLALSHLSPNARYLIPMNSLPPVEELRRLDGLLVPFGMEDMVDDPVFRKHNKLVVLRYGIDEGSMIYLEERIARIREERQLHPASQGAWSEAMKNLSNLRREPHDP